MPVSVKWGSQRLPTLGYLMQFQVTGLVSSRSGTQVPLTPESSLLTLMPLHQARVARLLGTSCCLVVSQEEGLAVSELQEAASPACSPEFLAGARCCWAATLATSLEWRLYRPAAPGQMPCLVPGVGPSPGGCTLFSSGKHRQMLSI